MGKAAGGPSGKGLLAGRKHLPGSFDCTLRCLDVVGQTLAAHFVTTSRGDKDKATDSGQQSRRLEDS